MFLKRRMGQEAFIVFLEINGHARADPEKAEYNLMLADCQ